MIGVTHYAGACGVCQHPDAEEITAALRARAGARGLSWQYPGLVYRDFKQHERQCLADRETTEKGAA